ncbi:synaptotagmin-like protein 3 isoform X2 [Dipodomys merriami]|uniref:synaptotagmin-like protein 3 isoform X2 n=1 Tax=Dipodomys merriami TaxID=94247 RepID=UPI003855DF15
MAHQVDLESLKELEREVILQVLYRDQAVRSREEERTRKLKTRLQSLRWSGAAGLSAEERGRRCARCARALGLLRDRGAACQGCSHRVCAACRVFPRASRAWRCTVCFEDRNVKIKTGEWFFEERAKKFPTEGTRETVGAKLLRSYQRLSKISVVPPTPPPLSENQCCGNPGRLHELGQFRGFNKSVENLFLSVTTHMKKLSKSQNDVTSEKHLLATCPRPDVSQTERRSQSDTAVNVTSRKASAPAILKPFHQEDLKHSTSPVLKQETPPSSPTPNTLFSGGLRHYHIDLSQLATRKLQVSVWHLGALARRAFLGEVIVPLATWDFEDSATRAFCWYSLWAKGEKCEDNVPQNNGELAVRAKLVLPAGPRKPQEAQEGTDQLALDGQLCLVVLGAKNLPVRSDGTLNSFVKGCLTLPDQQKLRLRSPVLKKQACPQWKHPFVFSGVTPAQLRQSSLELTVWDQALFGMSDRLLGRARLGSEAGAADDAGTCSQSKLRWQKVLSSPNLWTDMTLTLH